MWYTFSQPHFSSARTLPTEVLSPRGVLHHVARWGCAPVLGSFWPENSGIGIYFHWKISVIGVYFHLEFSGIGVECKYTPELFDSNYDNVRIRPSRTSPLIQNRFFLLATITERTYFLSP